MVVMVVQYMSADVMRSVTFAIANSNGCEAEESEKSQLNLEHHSEKCDLERAASCCVCEKEKGNYAPDIGILYQYSYCYYQ